MHVSWVLLARDNRIVKIDNLIDHYAVQLEHDRILIRRDGARNGRFTFYYVDFSDDPALDHALAKTDIESIGNIPPAEAEEQFYAAAE